jgi:uncharacterized protein (DUF2235 family)
MLIGLCVGGLLSGQVHALTEECPELTDVSPKKIAIFTDGTGNTKSDQTNVRRLYEKLVAQGRGDIVAYYDKGVGNLGTKIIGGALGVGLSRNVRQAYRCLAEHYLPGDQIYLFGFSRGAYTARVLGGVIHQMGVMRFPEGLSKSDQRVLVAELYDIYQHNGDADFDEQRERFQSVHPTQSVTIDVMAVWDTVAALGLTPARDRLHEQCLESGFLSWLGQFFGKDEDACLLERASTRLYQDYHQVGPQGIRKILHAVSIDERRNAFNIELYDEADLTSEQSLKQVWFAGVHSDIGGGYEDSDALSNITLNWMMQNLREDNLLSVDSAVQGRFDGRMHTSYKSFYKKVDPVIREIKPGSAIHRSAVQRMTGPLSQPNDDREPDGVYRPVQFEPCLQGQEPTTSRIEACGFNVVDD